MLTPMGLACAAAPGLHIAKYKPIFIGEMVAIQPEVEHLTDGLDDFFDPFHGLDILSRAITMIAM